MRPLFGLRPASQGLEVARISDRGPVDLDPRMGGDVARVGPADGEPQPGPARPDHVGRRQGMPKACAPQFERPALRHSAKHGKPSALRGGEVQYLDREERWGVGEL